MPKEALFKYLTHIKAGRSKDTSICPTSIKHLYVRIDEHQAGVYRLHPAIITGSKYPLPLPADVPALMQEFIVNAQRIRKENHTAIAAALIHKQFVFIHPFVDGNGRVARLLMNLILLQSGFTIALIPAILRRDYIAFLEKAHTDESDFIFFIAQAIKETQKDYIRLFLRNS